MKERKEKKLRQEGRVERNQEREAKSHEEERGVKEQPEGTAWGRGESRRGQGGGIWE